MRSARAEALVWHQVCIPFFGSHVKHNVPDLGAHTPQELSRVVPDTPFHYRA